MQVITCIESKWVLAQYARHRRKCRAVLLQDSNVPKRTTMFRKTIQCLAMTQNARPNVLT